MGAKAPYTGKVVEWLKALVLKTSDVKASVGSNPTLSVLTLDTNLIISSTVLPYEHIIDKLKYLLV